MPEHARLPEQFGRYRILQKLGEGGMGAVFLAEDTQLGRKVALKVPHFTADDGPAVIDRFLREARLAARIDHPNLCAVYDVGDVGGIHYFTMPHLEGTPLSRLVRIDRPWPPRHATEMVRQVALALAVLHQNGIVHRDLKPSNILVRKTGEPVLMDFGLARSFASQGQVITQTGSPLGTPVYMSPEQVNGDSLAIGPGSDVYSLGVILYELLTGQRPFEGPMLAVFAQVLNAIPQPPSARLPGLDARIDSLCLRALAKKPEERYPSMNAFAEAIVQYSRPPAAAADRTPAPPSTTSAREAIPVPRPPPRPRRPERTPPAEKQSTPRDLPAVTAQASALLRRTTCPHCWTVFAPEDVLWVSAHEDLRGDPRLGPDEQQRFLPTRFNLDGNALDARGFVCQTLACPRCHLAVPRVLLEVEPTFVSILGSPGCGKSFFLAAMTWELRRLLAGPFAVSFTDADTSSNSLLKHYENSLFLNGSAEDLQPLPNLIRKTEEVGADLYRSVRYGNQQVSYPRPFLFALQPQAHHPARAAGMLAGRLLCLYDNAGESFEVGKEATGNPVTGHLARSRLLMFLFDPLQDVRFRKLVRDRLGHPERLGDHPGYRQEAILQEAAARVRRDLGLPQTVQHDRPLVVVCTKFDAWAGLIGKVNISDPWTQVGRVAGLNVDAIQQVSLILRTVLLRVCPEVVSVAESFAREVTYVPASALGCLPVPGAAGKAAVRPRDIRPMGVTVPMLFGLHRHLPGLISSLKRPPAPRVSSRNNPPASPSPSAMPRPGERPEGP